MARPSGRSFDQLRKIEFVTNYNKYAEGSCLVRFGDTHVLCTASVEEKLPPFLRDKKQGWITAEYGMLPRATDQRNDREASRGKQSGRTQEIQRLIGRSLRSIIDLPKLGERQIKMDCDVLQADGGTRTAAITGAYIALHQALSKLLDRKLIKMLPLRSQVAAISCGIYKGQAVLDLDYTEDSDAEADANFVLTSDNRIIEIQATAEQMPFTEDQYAKLMLLARKGIHELMQLQNKALLSK